VHSDKLVQALLQTPQLLAKNMAKAVLRSAKEMARAARTNVNQGPNAFGTLRNTIKEKQRSPYEAIIAPNVNYAQMVEEGTSGGGKAPPRDSIEDWINVRGILPNDPFMDSRDLSFLIARSIAKKGTPPQPYLQPAFDDNKAKAERRINLAIDAALRGKQK
jgi:HK97 gp10 family phage protein